VTSSICETAGAVMHELRNSGPHGLHMDKLCERVGSLMAPNDAVMRLCGEGRVVVNPSPLPGGIPSPLAVVRLSDIQRENDRLRAAAEKWRDGADPGELKEVLASLAPNDQAAARSAPHADPAEQAIVVALLRRAAYAPQEVIARHPDGEAFGPASLAKLVKSGDPRGVAFVHDLIGAAVRMLEVRGGAPLGVAAGARASGAELQLVTPEGYTQLPEEMRDVLGLRRGGLLWFLRSAPGGKWEAWTADELNEALGYSSDGTALGPTDRLIQAIRRFTVDGTPENPNGPNGPAEAAFDGLFEALDPEGSRRLDEANAAAGTWCNALADDIDELRAAAQAYFGCDFRAAALAGQVRS